MTIKKLEMHQKTSLTNLYFNRFLAIRYSTAFFLFINLYWFVFLGGSLSIVAFLPLSILVLAILTMYEQIKLYRIHNNRLPYAKALYSALSVICIVLLISVNTSLFHLFFPFFKNTQYVLNSVMVVLTASLLINFLLLKKIKKIELNKDKSFQRIQAYQQVIN
jgi:hypothetical protein